MTRAKAVVPRESARRDVHEAIDFYSREAGQRVALGFVDALEGAYRLIGERPGAGFSRYAHALDLPELRGWPLRGYPFVIFCVERDDRVEVWRVLHAASDIPSWLAEEGRS